MNTTTTKAKVKAPVPMIARRFFLRYRRPAPKMAADYVLIDEDGRLHLIERLVGAPGPVRKVWFKDHAMRRLVGEVAAPEGLGELRNVRERRIWNLWGRLF